MVENFQLGKKFLNKYDEIKVCHGVDFTFTCIIWWDVL